MNYKKSLLYDVDGRVIGTGIELSNPSYARFYDAARREEDGKIGLCRLELHSRPPTDFQDFTAYQRGKEGDSWFRIGKKKNPDHPEMVFSRDEEFIAFELLSNASLLEKMITGIRNRRKTRKSSVFSGIPVFA